MKSVKFQVPSWKTGILKIIRGLPAAQIRDAFILIVILLVYIALLATLIRLSLILPTAT